MPMTLNSQGLPGQEALVPDRMAGRPSSVVRSQRLGRRTRRRKRCRLGEAPLESGEHLPVALHRDAFDLRFPGGRVDSAGIVGNRRAGAFAVLDTTASTRRHGGVHSQVPFRCYFGPGGKCGPDLDGSGLAIAYASGGR